MLYVFGRGDSLNRLKLRLKAKRENRLRCTGPGFAVTGVTLGVELITFVDSSGEVALDCFFPELRLLELLMLMLLSLLLLLRLLLLLNTDRAADCVRNLKAPLPTDQRLVKPPGLLPRFFAEMRITGVRLNGEVCRAVVVVPASTLRSVMLQFSADAVLGEFVASLSVSVPSAAPRCGLPGGVARSVGWLPVIVARLNRCSCNSAICC